MKVFRIDRRILTPIVLAFVLAALLSLPKAAFSQAPVDPVVSALQKIEHAAGARVEATRSSRMGLVTFMSTASAPVPLSLPATAGAEARARNFLSAHGNAFGIADVSEVALFRNHGPDDVGMEHVRFRQLHDGVPITAGELTVHLRGAGVVAVNAKTLAFDEKINTTPTVTAAQALAIAETMIRKRFAIVDASFSPPRLEIFNRGMLEVRQAPTRLAWFIEATRLDLRQFIWIDAQTGILLLDFSQLTDALNRSIYTANGVSTLPGTLVALRRRARDG